MTSQLNLQADKPGNYLGLSAQFSGEGFADMHFGVSVVPADAYAKWLVDTKATGPTLDRSAYAALAKPSKAVAPATYSGFAPGLFDSIVSETASPAPGSRSGAGGQTQPLKKEM